MDNIDDAHSQCPSDDRRLFSYVPERQNFVDIKPYLKEQFNNFKLKLKDEISSKDTSNRWLSVNFKYKGNKRQFDFSCEILSDIKHTQALVRSSGQLNT